MGDTVIKPSLESTFATDQDRQLLDRRRLLKTILALTGSYTATRLLGVSDIALGAQAPAQGETVKYPSGTVQVEGYLVKPSGSGKFPAVIVVHENRGLSDHIKDVTRRFAAEGFVALAPDLLSRLGGTAGMKTPNEVAAAINRLPILDGLADLREAVTYLSKQPNVDATKISVVGFGWGGWRSFMAATQVPTIYKTVVFYGTSPDVGMDKIRGPVLAHYASRDRAITGNSQWTAREMKKSGKSYTFYIYDNTDSAFFNDTGGARYSAEAAKLAWSRTLQFLKS